ncbi:hypothetical protein ACL9RL_18900 [Plantibacter sp. Mn2098]|uniref:hypothetical protein n=1 Tax=Plantibacter sp. Mn2098 TaxID=3395266 RepID=UPI003BDE114B
MPSHDITIQLRRYVIHPGLLEEFSTWWRELLVPAREASGFTVEFAYAVPNTNEFIWAVSLSGDEAHFLEIESEYYTSPGRASAFNGQPDRIRTQKVAFVENAGLNQ